MTIRRQRLWFIALGISVSGVFLWLAFRGTHFYEVLELVRGADLTLGIPLVLLLGLSYWAKAVRWRMLLRPVRSTTASKLFPAIIVGYAANNILPLQLGEVVRMYIVSRRLRVGNVQVLGTMVLERMLDFLTILVLLGLSVAVSKQNSSGLQHVAWFVGCAGVLMSLVSIAFVWWTDVFMVVVARITTLLPDRLSAVVLEQMEMASIGLGALRDPGLFLAATVLSGVQWLLMGGSVYVSIAAVDVSVPVSASIVVVAFIVAGLILPSSPGFVGTIQLGFVLALEPFGVLPADAVAASLVWHGFAIFSVAVGGIFFAFELGISPREILGRLGDTDEGKDTKRSS